MKKLSVLALCGAIALSACGGTNQATQYGPDGTPIVAGLDVAVLADDGRLRSVTGFFEAPAGAA